jgi:hypothetical protein
MPKGIHNGPRGGSIFTKNAPPPERPIPQSSISSSIRLSVEQYKEARAAADAMHLSLYAWFIYCVDTMIGVHNGKWEITIRDEDFDLELEPPG